MNELRTIAPGFSEEGFHQLLGHLSVMVLCCGTLRQELEKGILENRVEDLSRIEASAAKVCDLVKQFYSLAAMSERKKTAAREPKGPVSKLSRLRPRRIPDGEQFI